MFNIFEIIKLLFPYKMPKNKNNNIYVVKNGDKKKIKHKIKGLDVKYGKYAKNTELILHMPLSFNKTTIEFSGQSSKIEIKSTIDTIKEAYFLCAAFGEIFIDENSAFATFNSRILVNNNCKENPSRIHIGKNFLIGQDVLIRTSDGHSIYNAGEEVPYNPPKDIYIGDNVWIGARVVVLKGAKIPNNTVVGACSVVNKKFNEENTMLVGNPAKIVKRNVFWKRSPYGETIRKMQREEEKRLLGFFLPKKILLNRFKYKLKKFLKFI